MKNLPSRAEEFLLVHAPFHFSSLLIAMHPCVQIGDNGHSTVADKGAFSGRVSCNCSSTRQSAVLYGCVHAEGVGYGAAGNVGESGIHSAE